MNILMVTNTYTPIIGGLEKAVQSFTDGFRAKGHNVLILAPEFDNMPENEEGVIRIPAIRRFNGSDFSVRLPIPIMLFGELNKFKPDIVHAHHPFLLGDTALRIASRYQIPLVFTHHTKYEDYTHYVPLNSPAMKRFVIELSTGYANLADCVFAPSQSIKSLIVGRGVTTPVQVVPSGIDDQKFIRGNREAFRQRCHLSAEDFVIGHIGRLAPEKNIEFLLDAVVVFLKQHARAKFLVGGYGPSLQLIKSTFAQNGLSERLCYAGVLEHNDLIDAFHAMDVFAFSSKTETQGVVIIEAMAAGVPVVALAATGIVDVVTNDNGYLVKKESTEDFSNALMNMTHLSREKYQTLQANCRKTASQYSIERMCEGALTIYKTLRRKESPDYEQSPWAKAMAQIKTEWNLLRNLAGSASSALTPPSAHPSKKQQIDKLLAQWFFRIRRRINQNEWAATLLNLPKSNETESKPGLVMIQIDGFSRKQFERALREGRMPFLKSLIDKEHYRLYPYYSGLPSSTPGVQGELLYGVPQIVPAFSFYDCKSDSIVKMYHGPQAEEVEQKLKKRGFGLLEGGSSYSNIYSGAAKESHYCAVSLGLNKIWKEVNPFKFSLFVLTRFFTFVHMLFLVIWEFLTATIDCVKGVAIYKQDFKEEITFISARMLICILLRDLVTLGTKIDITRGVEVIHLNLLGYDEQSHRRGPSSKFAHSALCGIDASIASIYHTALMATRRNYDVWIYSDHGQEDVISYRQQYGKSVQQVIADIFAEFKLSDDCMQEERGIQRSRMGYLSARFTAKPSKPMQHELVVTAIGPTGNIYLSQELTLEQKYSFAQKLVEEGKIPMVLVPLPSGQVRVFNEKGEFHLPEDAKEVLGEHPYLDDVTHDLISVCHHPDAGAFTFSGWQPGKPYITFPIESGAHGGPGTEETNPFTLIPRDIEITTRKDNSIRTQDLRQAALRFLGRVKEEPAAYTFRLHEKPKTLSKRIRLMTYNVHSCVGLDGKISPERIARVIGRHEPDIVAMQELDMNRPRTGRVNQPHLIAQKLEMLCHFHPSFQIEEEHYGNAILSRYPMGLIYAGALPGLLGRPNIELRGALWTSIKIDDDVTLQFINTHLGLYKKERLNQIEALLSNTWLKHPECRIPIVLCGDFNALPYSSVYKLIGGTLLDAQRELKFHKPKATWFSHYPIGRIDHVFVSSDIKVVNVEVSRTSLDKVASDHLPLIVDIEIKQKDQGPAS
jgi:endonuclease/exonuclease/phosphatase family metal-dependent hydrolase/glycosyltransferase involved in cell wall biosynthesis